MPVFLPTPPQTASQASSVFPPHRVQPSQTQVPGTSLIPQGTAYMTEEHICKEA